MVATVPTQSWVVLTMGDRDAELHRALESMYRAGAADVTVVVNGADPGPVAAAVASLGATVVALPDNVGVPAGRNHGAAVSGGDIVFFLDDDAEVASGDLVSESLAMFAADPDLGIVGFRIVDPATGASARRHVPRLVARDPERSGEVTAFLGGACAIRRACLDSVGGYDGAFFYAMEETDLALRAIDAGWRVWYRGDLVVRHPATEPARHPQALERTARNRVVLARRSLPAGIAATYLLVWTVLGIVRERSVEAVRASWRGTRQGFAQPVDRRPIRWRTVVRLTRLGRPPII